MSRDKGIATDMLDDDTGAATIAERTRTTRGRGRPPTYGDKARTRHITIRVSDELYDELRILALLKRMDDPSWSMTAVLTRSLEDLVAENKDLIDGYDRSRQA